MYDNQMFDNVFFSAKSYVDNEVEMSLTVREQAQQYSQFAPEIPPETDEEERERREQAKISLKKKKKQAKFERMGHTSAQTSKKSLLDRSVQPSSSRQIESIRDFSTIKSLKRRPEGESSMNLARLLSQSQTSIKPVSGEHSESRFELPRDEASSEHSKMPSVQVLTDVLTQQ